MGRSILEQFKFFQDLIPGLMTKVVYAEKFYKKWGAPTSNFHLDEVDLVKLQDLFTKHFPDEPPNWDKVQGSSTFQAQAASIAADLELVFQLFLNIRQLHVECLKFLHRLLEDFVVLNYHQHTSIYTQVMDLFVELVKFHLVWIETKQFQGLISIAGFCYRTQHIADHPEFEQLARFLMQYQANPIAAFQMELQGQPAQTLIQILLSLAKEYPKLHEPSDFRQANAFDFSVNSPQTTQLYLDLLKVGRMTEWIIYGCLCCPEQLNQEELIQLYQHAASKCIVVDVFGRKKLDFHNMLSDICSVKDFQSTTIQGIPLKKLIKTTAKQAILHSGTFHHHRRVFLKWSLANILKFLHHTSYSNELIMILCSCHLAKEEILWYFHHLQVTCPNRVKSKHLDSSTYDNEYVAEILGFMQQILIKLKSQQLESAKYYQTQLQTNDSFALKTLITEFLQQNPSIDERIHSLITQFPSDFQHLQLEKIQPNWNKILIYCLCSKIEMPSQLNKQMNEMLMKIEIVETFEGLCSDLTNLKKLWYFRDEYQDIYEEGLSGMKPRNPCLNFIQAIDEFGHNTHWFCPEMQPEILDSIEALVLKSIDLYSDQFLQALEEYFTQFHQLHQQLEPQEAANRYQRQQQQRELAFRSRSFQPKPPEYLPGFESRMKSAGKLEPLAQAKEQVVAFYESMIENPSLKIGAQEYHIQVLIQQKLLQFFKTTLRQCVAAHKDQPLEVLNLWKTWTLIILELDSHLPQEFRFLNVIQQAKSEEIHDGESFNLLKEWFYTLVDRVNSSIPIKASSKALRWCLSEYVDGVIELKANDFSTSKCIYDQNQFYALAELIGMEATQELENYLMHDIIATQLQHFVQLLTQDQAALSEFVTSLMPMDNKIQRLLSRLNHLEEMGESLLKAGNALVFLRWLTSAMNHVYEKYHIVNSIEDYNQHPQACDYNTRLSKALAPLKEGTAQEVSGLLPYAIACVFKTRLWRKAEYIDEFDAFDNNAHTMIHVAYVLLQEFRPNVRLPFEPETFSKKLESGVQVFVRTCAQIILYLATHDKKYVKRTAPMYLFMEKFGDLVPEIDCSYLESCFPHELIHSAYIQLCLKGMSKSSSALKSKLYTAPSEPTTSAYS